MDAISLCLQAVATITTIAATWFIGNKKPVGPALAVVSCAAFISLNAYLGLWLLMPIGFTTLGLNIRNTIKWIRG
jgi:hypothetical protein